jgi:splicing factor 3B subunit 2
VTSEVKISDNVDATTSAEKEGEKEENKDEQTKAKLSKKQRRKLNRLGIAELKQLVTRPDVVEVHP